MHFIEGLYGIHQMGIFTQGATPQFSYAHRRHYPILPDTYANLKCTVLVSAFAADDKTNAVTDFW